MGQPQGWKGPFRWYEARCPHCGMRHDLRNFDYALVGGDQDPEFACETPQGGGCKRMFDIPRTEDTKLVWTRPK